MKTLKQLLEKMQVNANKCSNRTKEERARKGAYVDVICEIKSLLNYQMKIAYIAHPVGGDVSGNIEKIKAIGRQINKNEPNVVPFAPYFFDLFTLDDADFYERERGIRNDTELFNRGFIDEVRLYGNRLSAGMKFEILQALKLGIPVVPMTQKTEDQYKEFLKEKQ